MIRTSVLLLLLCAGGMLQAQTTRPYDVQHYHFDIQLNDSNNIIAGAATILVQLKGPSTTLPFDLALKGSQGKGMTVSQVSGRSVRGFSAAEGQVRVFLMPDIKSGDTLSLTIHYSGIPSDGLIISRNKFGKRTFFADNWPDRAHNWIPCADIPGDKAPVSFTVTAPAHYRVVANGTLQGETLLASGFKQTRWKEDTPLPPKVMVIGVADFAVEETGSINGVPVSSWVFAENKENGFYDYKPAKEILGFFMDYIGPYAYQKLANVQSATIFGGMENASNIFYFENSVTGQGGLESLLSHEIVHQWFGDMATEKAYPHLWLSEGFATYLTHVYMEKKYGADSLAHEMQTDREAIIEFSKTHPLPVVDSISPTMRLLNANSYQKGSWVLHMLRQETGDSNFHRIIRTYYDRYKGRNADTHDFQSVAEQVSRLKLDTFFHQWLYRPGMPDLRISWTYLPRLKRYRLNVEQTQSGDAFQFPLELSVAAVFGKPVLYKMKIRSKTESLLLPVKMKPLTVTPDPNTRLLFTGKVTGGN